MYSEKIANKRNRILAFIIDYLIFFLIFLFFGIFFGEKLDNEFGYQIKGLPAFVLILIGLFLWPFSEAYSGQTIGKKIVGLKVVNESFKDISTSQAFIRFFIGFIDFCCFFIGLIVASSNNKKQRIGDIVAKTIVVDVNNHVKNS
jgi:uncharacterized RDD family membrane protein YckC